MVSVIYERGSVSTVLDTQLNSLGDDQNAISGEINNGAALEILDDVELVTAAVGYAFDAGAIVELFLVESVDGSTFADGDGTIDPASKTLVGVFRLRAETVAQRHVIHRIKLPANRFKYLIVQKTGQTWASSNNTLRRLPYKYRGA